MAQVAVTSLRERVVAGSNPAAGGTLCSSVVEHLRSVIAYSPAKKPPSRLLVLKKGLPWARYLSKTEHPSLQNHSAGFAPRVVVFTGYRAWEQTIICTRVDPIIVLPFTVNIDRKRVV